MKFPVIVTDEYDSSFDGKKGHKDQRSLIVADQSEGRRLMHFIEYPLSPEERTKFSGKVNGKVASLTIMEVGTQLFGGRVKVLRGEISFDTK